jgi:hypothetical protein
MVNPMNNIYIIQQGVIGRLFRGLFSSKDGIMVVGMSGFLNTNT